MNRRAESRRRGLWIGAGIAAAALCVLWCFVVPEKANSAVGVQSATIRIAHPLCWGLFAAAAFGYAWRRPAGKRGEQLRTMLVSGAGVSYAGFATALLL